MEIQKTNNTEQANEETSHDVALTAVPHEVASDGHDLKHEQTLYAEPVFHIGSFGVTNALVTSWAAVLIIIVIAVALRLSIKKIPGKLQHIFEIFIEGALSVGDQITNDRKITEKVLPIASCVFFFILINNWLGIMPFMAFGVVEHGNTFIPFLRSGTADLNTNIAIAVIAVLGSNIFGIFIIGGWKMLNKYINLKALGGIFTKIRKDPAIILVAPITFAVGLIEIVGEMAKVASLSLRLFGNVFAGEVLLASMGAMVAYFVPIPFLLLEVGVGLIQAFIFAVLTTVYFTIAAQDHDHEEGDGHGSHSEEHGSHVLDEVPGEDKEIPKTTPV
ncbi:MAG: F0F1 ATP synthase subunit A [Candidatus Pacebacteria bacterium]|nr:F0F1 ATP synthase subunit A [Candidatus Paceibacterota bacterium]